MIDGKLFPIFLVMFTEVLGFSLLLPFLPYYASQLGATPLTISAIFAVFSFSQFLSAPIVGKLSDKYGRKPLFLISQFSTFLSFVILGFAKSVEMIFVSRIVDGIFGSNMIIARAYIADITSPAERTKIYSQASGVFAFGFMIGPAVGGYLSRWGYHVPSFLAAFVSLVALYLITRLEETVERKHEMEIDYSDFIPLRQLARAWKRDELRDLLIEFAVFISAFSMMMPNFAVLLDMKFGIDASTVGILLMFVGVFRIVLQAGVLPRLVGMIGDEALKLSGFLALPAAFLAFLREGLLYPGMMLFSYGGSAIRPVIMSEASKRAPPRRKGEFLGVFDSIDSLSRVFAPLVGGALIQFASPDALPVAGATIMLVGFVFSATHRMRPSHTYKETPAKP